MEIRNIPSLEKSPFYSPYVYCQHACTVFMYVIYMGSAQGMPGQRLHRD